MGSHTSHSCRSFHHHALSAADLALGLAASSLVFWAVELGKWLLRRGATLAGRQQRRPPLQWLVQRTIPRRKGDAGAQMRRHQR